MQEQLFQLLSGIVAVSWITLWLWGASRGGLGKKIFWHNSLEPWWVFWPVRLLVLLSAFSMLCYLLKPELIQDVQHPLLPSLRFLGLAVAVAGLSLFYQVFSALAGQFSTSLVLQEEHQLISSGPYRFIRHPMYWAYILMWLSLWLLTASPLIGASGVIAIVYVMLARTPKEEAMLAEQFGDAWQEYCERTGRYFPKR